MTLCSLVHLHQYSTSVFQVDNISTFIYVCVSVCMYTYIYIYIYTHTHIYVYMRACLCVCVCVCVCACVCVCSRVYIHIYIEQNVAHFCIVAAYHYVIKRPKTALTFVICLAMPYFYTLPHKGTF